MRNLFYLVLMAGTSVLWSPVAFSAALIASDDFESGTLSGGSANPATWQEDWQVHQSAGGGTFMETTNPIEGTTSVGLFGNGGETWISRQHKSQDGNSALPKFYTYNWQMSSAFDIMVDGGGGVIDNRMGGIIRDGNDGANPFGGEVFSVYFEEGNTELQYFDGTAKMIAGYDFAVDAVYDITVQLNPTLNTYELSVFQVGPSGPINHTGASGTYTSEDGSPTLDSFVFHMRGPAGAGNDVFFDQLTITRNVPEPGTVIMLGMGMLIIRRYHARRKAWVAPIA